MLLVKGKIGKIALMEKTWEEKTYTLEILYHIGALEDSIHFVFDHKSKKCAIIDPAWEADLFIQKVADKGYTLSDIWLTHWHFDHTNAVDEIFAKTGAKITAGINEIDYLQIDSLVQTVADNQTIWLGETSAKIINTPGHSAGGICFLLDGHLLAGDTLFVYGAGHCSLPGGNAHDLFASMQKLKQLPDETLLHCGHDYGAKIITTLKEQKRSNAYLLIDNENDFVHYVEQIQKGIIPYPTKAMSKSELDILL